MVHTITKKSKKCKCTVFFMDSLSLEEIRYLITVLLLNTNSKINYNNIIKYTQCIVLLINIDWLSDFTQNSNSHLMYIIIPIYFSLNVYFLNYRRKPMENIGFSEHIPIYFINLFILQTDFWYRKLLCCILISRNTSTSINEITIY